MEISLPTRLQEYIQSKIETGRYESAEAVIEDALQLLDTRDSELDELRRSVTEAYEGVARGESVVASDDHLAQIVQRARQQIEREDGVDRVLASA
jgi:putative addiction module CopG family antidote